MPRQLQTGQTIKQCAICGCDLTGMPEREICYLCEVETTPEIRPWLIKKRINYPDM